MDAWFKENKHPSRGDLRWIHDLQCHVSQSVTFSEGDNVIFQSNGRVRKYSVTSVTGNTLHLSPAFKAPGSTRTFSVSEKHLGTFMISYLRNPSIADERTSSYVYVDDCVLTM